MRWSLSETWKSVCMRRVSNACIQRLPYKLSIWLVKLINPWRMREGYGSHSECLSVTKLAATYIPRLQVQNCGVIRFQTHVLCGFSWKHFVCLFWHRLLMVSFLICTSHWLNLFTLSTTRPIWTSFGSCDWSTEICHFRGRKSVSGSISAIKPSNVCTMLTIFYHMHCYYHASTLYWGYDR